MKLQKCKAFFTGHFTVWKPQAHSSNSAMDQMVKYLNNGNYDKAESTYHTHLVNTARTYHKQMVSIPKIDTHINARGELVIERSKGKKIRKSIIYRNSEEANRYWKDDEFDEDFGDFENEHCEDDEDFNDQPRRKLLPAPPKMQKEWK